MISRHTLGALTLSLVLAQGCAKSEPPAPAAEPTPTPVASVAPVAPPPSPEPVAEIPTEEDFEEEAGRELTAANLDAQLDALEKEIQSE